MVMVMDVYMYIYIYSDHPIFQTDKWSLAALALNALSFAYDNLYWRSNSGVIPIRVLQWTQNKLPRNGLER